MKAWVMALLASSFTGFFIWEAEHYLEYMLKLNPTNAPFIILCEWAVVGLPLIAGSILVIEEMFYLHNLPTAPKVVNVKDFVAQVKDGKLKLSHDDIVQTAEALDGRLKVEGEKVSVGVVKQDKPKIQIERGV